MQHNAFTTHNASSNMSMLTMHVHNDNILISYAITTDEPDIASTTATMPKYRLHSGLVTVRVTHSDTIGHVVHQGTSEKARLLWNVDDTEMARNIAFKTLDAGHVWQCRSS